MVVSEKALKAACTRKARELLTGWGHEPVEGAIKEVSAALSAARAEERESDAKKCDELAKQKFQRADGVKPDAHIEREMWRDEADGCKDCAGLIREQEGK